MLKKRKISILIWGMLLLLVSTVTSSSERRYLIELDESNLNATTEFIESFQTVVDIHRVISHRFLQAVSIRIKENNDISLFQSQFSIRSISPISIIHSKNSMSKMPKFSPDQVNLMSPHRLSQVDKVHQELKLTGEGVFIGVIDTGVDYYHPALGGGFGPGFKIVAGYDLVGDNWNHSDPDSIPEPDDDPLDNCGKDSEMLGHGTHISGIIAGFDEELNFTGVAPEAKLGIWRVLNCDGAGSDDAIIAAMLMAFDAGVDIINLSLGSNSPWSASSHIYSKIISKISASGVSVVVAAGNSGNNGAFTTGWPGNVMSAFEVASVNNEYMLFDGSFTATGILEPINFNIGVNSNLTMPDSYLTLSYNGTNSPESDACKLESISTNILGNIALIKRGGCSFQSKVTNVALKGAIGAIVYDNIHEPPITVVVDNSTIPLYLISLSDGLMLLKAHDFKTPKNLFLNFSIDKGPIFLESKYATIISDFSSVGPTVELNLKPNIAAVGQSVYSTLPRQRGGWGFSYGTSMACPYVVGSIALYLEYHGKNATNRNIVHEKFQNFALVTSLDNTTSGYLDNPLRQGSGLIQVYDTILGTAHITPSQISFNDTSTIDYRIQNLTITNDGLESIYYRIFNNVSISLSPYNRSVSGYAYVEPALNTFEYANIEFSVDQVSLNPGQSQTIQVSVYPPNIDPLDHIMYGGFIQFKAINHTTKDLHVPYFGVVGNQRDIPVLDKKYFKIGTDETNTIYDIDEPIYFNLTSPEPGYILIYYRLPVPTLVLKGELVLNENNGTRNILGYAFPPLTYSSRDFADNSVIFDPIFWSGKYIKTLPYDILSDNLDVSLDLYTTVGAGNYSILISALKQFGDMNNDGDWESFYIGPLIVK